MNLSHSITIIQDSGPDILILTMSYFDRDAYKELEKVNDLATEAFNLAQDNEARVEATKLKLVAVLMTKVFFISQVTASIDFDIPLQALWKV